MSRRIERMWIVWETQRRSEELARRLRCSLHVFDIEGPRRYPVAIARTVWLLARHRPRYLFVQNPSIVLAGLACLYGMITRTFVVVDRHSNFPHISMVPCVEKPSALGIGRHVFMALHFFTLRTADLTIVTNDHLATLVREAGGRPFVLADPIPVLSQTALPKLQGRRNVLVISSFFEDEPTAEVLEAARRLPLPDVCVYFSGNPRRGGVDWTAGAPPNVVFTGFLPSSDFVNLLFAVDAVVVLTTADHCLLCGCYEAVAADKPLITSAKTALQQYFRDAEFVQPTADSIVSGLMNVLQDLRGHQQRIVLMRREIGASWARAFADLERQLEDAV